MNADLMQQQQQQQQPTAAAAAAADEDAVDAHAPLQWIFRGNMVVPTGNPFHPPTVSTAASTQCMWLGPVLQLLVDHILTVDRRGFIRDLECAEQYLLRTNNNNNNNNNHNSASPPTWIELHARTEFLCPGFVDTHLHAPQFAYTGTATDLPLLGPRGWLEMYTFPSERRLGHDLDWAASVYERVVTTTLRHGTTTAVYYATLDAAPTRVLVDVCGQLGQRALIGKVCMDRHAPQDYCQSTKQNLEETEQVMEYIYQCAGKRHAHEDPVDTPLPLVLPMITPRFIPTCTPELLSGLGQLAASPRHRPCHITTHVSESWDEVAISRQLDAEHDYGDGIGRTDCVILDAHQLLTRHSLLAHAVHLTPSDQELLQQRGATIAHCPLSNFFFAGQCLPCRALLQQQQHHIPIGLGTDVAGGYSPSMMQAARMAVVASHALQQQQPHDNSNNNIATNHILDYRHAFYLATLGGATALRLHHRIGTLAVGMEFDAFIWSANHNNNINNVPLFPTDTLQDIFQKLCTLGDDRNVQRVFVQGRQVVHGVGSEPGDATLKPPMTDP